MRERQALPYGSWPSPITAADVAMSDASVEWVGFLGADLCWVESLPAEHGRAALIRSGGGHRREVVPGWHVKSRVIEYGGRPWAAVSSEPTDGLVVVNGADQRVYLCKPDQEPLALTPVAEGGALYRYADFTVVEGYVWCLRETLFDEAGQEVRRHLVSFPLSGSASSDGDAVVQRAATHHFMSGPKISADGQRVAWLGWDHPHMPWDATEVMVASRPCDDSSLLARRVAGADAEAISQLEWAPDRPEVLLIATDRSGWWNIEEINLGGQRRSLCPRPEEFAEALWRIGQRWFLPLDDGRIVVVHGTNRRHLGVLRADGSLQDLDTDFTEWQSICADGLQIAVVAASPHHGRTILRLNLEDGTIDTDRPPVAAHDAYDATPELRSWQHDSGLEVHAHLYRPWHPSTIGPPGELPPYLVVAHGGPTSRSHAVRNKEFSYFTSRGIGVVDVQYGGSTGFGREYRERLRGAWGVVDVEDLELVAKSLTTEGSADPDRISVRGGSAGGWTAACALGRASRVFCAAAIYYPVISPELWRESGTHDFESRYLDPLLGPWPEAREIYTRRSPLRNASRITSPFLLLQGEDDKVCPPAQALALLEEAGGDPATRRYLLFPGEGHGFVRLDTLTTSLEAELRLYQTAFGVLSPDTDGQDR